MLKLTGWDTAPMHVAVERIMAVSPSKHGPGVTTLLMACGSESEEWQIREPFDVVLEKVEDARHE